MIADDDQPKAWERVERISVYNSPRRARFPSLITNQQGKLLLLFTRQTPEQERTGIGDLLLCGSTDQGKTWSDPEVVYHGRDGEPRAMDTMTMLRSGRIIVPFVVWQNGGGTSKLRLLASENDDEDWIVDTPEVDSPLVWLSPCGPIIETDGGQLIMMVHGAISENDLRETAHGVGQLRSSDGGKRWGDFRWTIPIRQSIVGAAKATRFSFERPAVTKLADGRWLALASARRLGEGPGSPMVLVRTWSRDEGRTWTKPEQLAVGAWPSVATVDKRTSFCAFTCYAAWGDMRVLFSDDGFNTFFQERPVVQRCWLDGMTYRTSEVPPPPLVPYLVDHWPYEHYGFASSAALGADRVAVAVSRTQRGTIYWDYRG